MKTRILGKSGMQVSEVGLGCWQLGGDFGPVAEDVARQILRAADESGITFWDTADVYGGGLSETRIGNYLKANQPDVIVATKVGRDPGLYPNGYTRAKVRASIEASARRLGVESLDLVQLHCVPPDVLKAGDLFAWLEDFRKEGLLREFGASVETLDEARFAAGHPVLASLQIIFNIFRQDATTELFDYAMERDVGIIVRLPLASGVLSGKMRKDREFDTSDHRNFNRNGEVFSQGETFSGIPFEQAVDFADELRDYVPASLSMAQMAVRWILDHPAVTTVISGASRPEQVFENAGASGKSELPGELHEALARFYADRVKPAIRVPV
jgi:aryl-alcohol dehydrogenase-like predicted oxidoreductase